MNIPKCLSKRIINSYCTQLMTSIISMRHVVQHWRVSNSGCLYWNTLEYLFAGNKTKERISKRVFQGNKARQIVRKTNISYPLIRMRTCVYQEVRMFVFWKIWRAFCSWNTRFEIRSCYRRIGVTPASPWFSNDMFWFN